MFLFSTKFIKQYQAQDWKPCYTQSQCTYIKTKLNMCFLCSYRARASMWIKVPTTRWSAWGTAPVARDPRARTGPCPSTQQRRRGPSTTTSTPRRRTCTGTPRFSCSAPQVKLNFSLRCKKLFSAQHEKRSFRLCRNPKTNSKFTKKLH